GGGEARDGPAAVRGVRGRGGRGRGGEGRRDEVRGGAVRRPPPGGEARRRGGGPRRRDAGGRDGRAGAGVVCTVKVGDSLRESPPPHAHPLHPATPRGETW